MRAQGRLRQGQHGREKVRTRALSTLGVGKTFSKEAQRLAEPSQVGQKILVPVEEPVFLESGVNEEFS